MNRLQLYIKIAWQLKTPFVLLLDNNYRSIDPKTIQLLLGRIGMNYTEDYSDCDDFAWYYKGLASKEGINGVGFVIGRSVGGVHAWNILLTSDGIYQLEPQNGNIFHHDKRYKAWGVII